MEKKNVVFLTVLAVATLLTAVVGTTFAYFTATVTNEGTIENTSITAARLGATYSETDTLSESAIKPNWSKTKTITVTSTTGTTVAVPYDIKLKSITSTFVKDTIPAHCSDATKTTSDACSAAGGTWTAETTACNLIMTVSKGATVVKTLELCSDSTNPVTAGETLATGSLANAGDSDAYTVKVEFKESNYPQNDNQGKNLSMQFETVAKQVAQS